jgi:hypothetical protein
MNTKPRDHHIVALTLVDFEPEGYSLILNGKYMDGKTKQYLLNFITEQWDDFSKLDAQCKWIIKANDTSLYSLMMEPGILERQSDGYLPLVFVNNNNEVNCSIFTKRR